jgi:hypothetical protein
MGFEPMNTGFCRPLDRGWRTLHSLASPSKSAVSLLLRTSGNKSKYVGTPYDFPYSLRAPISGRLKQRIVAKKTDEFQQYGQQVAAFAKQYTQSHPQLLQTGVPGGKYIHPISTPYVHSGDQELH